ncbi:hypothetical protein M5D96_005146, partial [Drosophila gunungcola]
LALLVLLVSWTQAQTEPYEDPNSLKVWLTISARKRFLEVSWSNAPARMGDQVLVTRQDALSFDTKLLPKRTPLATFHSEEGIRPEAKSDTNEVEQKYWVANGGATEVVAAIQPTQGLSTQWFTTGLPFDYALSRNVTVQTSCYGFWASYIDVQGNILAKTCLKSLVTKYALTQDDDIRGQLMHGVRYLDIRVGYYRNSPDPFFIYHGITKQRPLQEVINQVRDFVHETNEIIIFGLKEFPVGFGKGLGVHRLLISYLRDQFQDLIAHPSLSWRASLRDIWARRQNVFLAYDHETMVEEFPEVLFGSVEQRWGNKQTRFSSRPVSDMAELTPETWDVIFDKHGGLRKMADNVNWRISQLYRNELGTNANIVSADFIRGTTLVETAIEYNTLPNKLPGKTVSVLKHRKRRILQDESVVTQKRNDRIKKRTATKDHHKFRRAESFAERTAKRIKQTILRTNITDQSAKAAEDCNPKLIFVMRHAGKKIFDKTTAEIFRTLGMASRHNANTKENQLLLRVIEPFVVYGNPSLSSIRELVFKKGFARIDGKKTAIQSNTMVEEQLGDKGVICLEDIIHEICTVGPNFAALSSPSNGWQKKVSVSYKRGGEYGDRGSAINELIARCLLSPDEWEMERNGLNKLLARSLKEPILGKHFALPGRTDQSQPIELDTSQSYIAVYTHLKVYATGMPERLPTPEAIGRDGKIISPLTSFCCLGRKACTEVTNNSRRMRTKSTKNCRTSWSTTNMRFDAGVVLK